MFGYACDATPELMPLPISLAHALMRRPIYAPTAAYGHFGREDLNLPWERTEGVAQSVSHPVTYPRGEGAWISCASSTPADVER